MFGKSTKQLRLEAKGRIVEKSLEDLFKGLRPLVLLKNLGQLPAIVDEFRAELDQVVDQ